MSAWYGTDPSDIDIDHDKSEVNLYVTYDDFGTIYKTLTFKQIEEIYGKINDPKPN